MTIKEILEISKNEEILMKLDKMQFIQKNTTYRSINEKITDKKELRELAKEIKELL